jgi:hypothetical protein
MPKAPLGFPEGYFSGGGGSGIPLVAAAAKKGKRGRQGVTNTDYVGRRRGGRSADVTSGRPARRGRS